MTAIVFVYIQPIRETLKHGNRNPEPEPEPESGIRNPESGIWKPESGIHKSKKTSS